MDKQSSVTTTFVVKKIIFDNHCLNGKFTFKPEIFVSFSKLADNEWESSFCVRVINKEGTPFPFDVDVAVSLITKFNGELPPKEELISYLKVGSLNILYPYVRSVLTNVSTAAMVAPIILPVADVREFSKNIKIPELEN